MQFSAYGFTTTEIEFMIQVLNHPRGWNVPFYYNAQTKKIQVFKMLGNEIDTLFKSNDLVGLSVCDRTNPQNIKIYLRKENWDSIPQVSGYNSLQQYRIYLILHEFGHALGHDHVKCKQSGDPAPVMLQQTKGTGQCYPDPWVVKV
jgi:hypothetical protein